MMLILWLFLLSFLFFAGHLYAQDVRALWVWGESSAIIELSSARTDFYEFCESPPGSNNINSLKGSPHPVNRIYFYAPSYINEDSVRRTKLHAFLKDAHSHGLEIEYLDGSPDWATTSQSTGKKQLERVLEFNSEATDPAEKFDGIQFDVEPYLLPGWSDQTTQIEIWNSYIGFVRDLQAKIDSVNDGMYFGVAIPRWFENRPGLSHLQSLIDIVDYVAIMNYVDTAPRLIKDASTEIAYANTIPGKKVVVGVETKKVEPETVCFHEEGWGNMESMLYEMDKVFRSYESYSGIAVHSYTYYRNLPQFGSDATDVTPPILIEVALKSESREYIDFYIVDITGTGLDESSSLKEGKIFLYQETTQKELSGEWQWEKNHLLFYPDSTIGSDVIRYLIYPVDSAGNKSVIDDTLHLNVTASQEIFGVDKFHLYQNYPNPFNPYTKIRYSIPHSSFVSIKIVDPLGIEIENLLEEEMSAGEHQITWYPKDTPSGVYFYQIKSDSFSLTKKMILIK